MTDEEIIALAKQAGARQLMSPTKHENLGLLGSDAIITLARLIAKRQREIDAGICDMVLNEDGNWCPTGHRFAAAILTQED